MTAMQSPMMPDSSWSIADNKAFEMALAQHFRDKERWSKIAAKVPGKTAQQIQRHYQQLEADVIRIQEVAMSSAPEPPAKKQKIDARPPVAAGADRRKGVPWTEEEHRLFLLGLAKFGKGCWRSISRQYVVTRTPTQVASHAQKYFLRLNSVSDKKDKRRASIHDITTDHVMPVNPYMMGPVPGVPAMMAAPPAVRLAAK